MVRKKAPAKEQTSLFGKSTKEFKEEQQQPMDERMRAATRLPVCVVCNEPGPDTHSTLCGGPAHEACAKRVKLEARKNENYAEVANRNAGVGKTEPRMWGVRARRTVSGKDNETYEHILECSAGRPDEDSWAAHGSGDGLEIMIKGSGGKIDTVNTMFRAALESVGFKEEK